MFKTTELRTYLMLLRPQQWTKNLLVLAALLFAAQLRLPAQCYRAFKIFAAFCFVSSAIYVFNDVLDRKADREHPRKRHRPIAAGLVPPRTGILLGISVLLFGLILAHGATLPALACVFGYIALQFAYSTVLKHLVILDVMTIAAGFILRAVAGAYAIEVVISPWLLICTILLALFIALSKRRSELLTSMNSSSHRRVLGQYNLAFLDQMIAVVTSCTLLAYVLYTYSEQTVRKFPSHMMPLTLPFVLYGIFRYLYLIYHKSEGGEPEILFIRDLPLLIDIVLWAATVAVIAGMS